MDKREYIDAVATAAAAIEAAGGRDITAPVPSCPGWTLVDLITHVGGIHRWAASIVTSGTRPDGPLAQPSGLAGPDLVAWLAQGAVDLVAALEATDPDKNVWTFGLPRSAAFWLRRQAHETTLHAWDAANATNTTNAPPTLTPNADLAADGLDEFLDLLPRTVKREPGSWQGETFHFHRTDGPGEWLVRLGPDGEATVDRAHAKADVALRADAASLLLWATNRTGTDQIDVVGDASLLPHWATDIRF